MVPMMGMTAAFVFAAQMLNFPIGGGTSGHFLGAAFVAAALGGWNACLALTLVLVIQCLGFADGGITALGANVVNMAVVGGLGGYVLMRALRSMLPGGRFWYLAAVAAAAWASVVLAATACALELAISGTSPLGIALPAMAGTHAVIGVGEALITASVLSIVAAARPDVLPEWARLGIEPHGQPARRRAWALAAVGLGAALALAALVSPFASSDPDGLEKVAGEKGFLHRAEGSAVWGHSPLPDYATPGVKSESASTALAGVLGTAAVFAAGFGLIRLASGRASGEPRAKE
jgi:cobalt/nickel transport system permease protein